ncbi:hypothetical protein NDU88_003907 [Pleurodeles waltl]|uniref:Uncharacterized protein n=1 Tax=Pleurodeles waltl TaxID=8319 RepID=A0AAV7LPF7_PLEWA|nr:hypothetical protein NDU88_003907 [Pleurodeles waltl]
MADTDVSGSPDTSLPRSHVSGGTLPERGQRFPVAGETPEGFRAAVVKEESGRGVKERKGASGETPKKPTRAEEFTTVEETLTRDESEEKESVDGGAQETERPGASHDPGGSWLAKALGLSRPNNHAAVLGAVSLGSDLRAPHPRPNRALAGRPTDRGIRGRQARPPVGGWRPQRPTCVSLPARGPHVGPGPLRERVQSAQRPGPGVLAGRSRRPRVELRTVRAHLRGSRAPGGPPGCSIRGGTARTFFPGPLLIRALCVLGPGPGVSACWWRSPDPYNGELNGPVHGPWEENRLDAATWYRGGGQEGNHTKRK